MENLRLNLEFIYRLENSAWFKLKYIAEKILRKATLSLGTKNYYLFGRDYVLKTKDFLWSIKAHSDFDDIARPSYEHELIPYFACTGVFVDIGACIGKWSLFVSETASSVYSFEPDPGVYKYLVENVELNHASNIKTFNLGISSSNGTARFFIEVPEHSGGSKITKDGGWEIKTVVLDSLHLPEIELMKIDVEGHEFDVLKGARKTLERTKRILCEIWGNQPNKRAIFDYMDEMNFSRQQIDSSNFLFVKNSHKNVAPRVSVIIPTYNRPKLVRRAIESVLAQTYSNFELLVIDDRGDPATKSVVEEIAKKDKRIRYIPNEVRLGLMENKNKGVRLSNPSSEYIAFSDDDDAYLPRFLERTIAELNKNPEAVAACTDCELRHQNGTFIKRYRCEQKDFWRFSLGNGTVIRKSVFTKLNIWFDKNAIFEDLDFGIRVVKDHPWVSVPEVLRTYYRYYSKAGDSMSTMYTKATPRETLEYFLKKNGAIYAAAGNQALAWVHVLTGKMLMRAGHKAAGREHLRAALKYNFRPSYAMYYFVALVFPGAFLRTSIAVFKNKITGMFGK